ncbi:MAG: M4 family metallopeptidase, partial [Candidatus Hinthialibacter sp.]
KTHVILQQRYQDAPVWGAEIGVHFDEENNPYQVAGVYAPTPSHIPASFEHEITQEQAIANAKKAIGNPSHDMLPPSVQKMVYWDINRTPVMCWNVSLTPSYVQSWDIFISVADGSVVHRYNKTVSASRTASAADLAGVVRSFNCWEDQSAYYAIDATRPMFNPATESNLPPQTAEDFQKLAGVIIGFDFRGGNPDDPNAQIYDIATNDINNWDPTAVTLMYYYGLIDGYYRSTFNRNSIDNKGLRVMFFIHPQWEWGNDNAYWSTQFNAMFFGDADQLGGGKLPLGMDIIAHEYTHGVTNFEAGLIYETQSGALDEGFSDFFGCMVDREDWLLAEDIIPLGNNPGKIAMRDMSQPGNPQVTDQNPAVMAEYRNLPIDQDNGGVHINCGIPSYMMYLLAEGGDYAISKEKTEQIIYQARNNYLTQRSQFIDFRRACESAARDLYGENSAEVQAVQKAADAIGLQEAAAPSSPSTPGQVVSGDEQIIFLLADPSAGVDYFREDYYYQMVLNAGGENYSLAPRYVANTWPAVSGDGKWGLYVDALNDIYWTDGYQEERWTDTGIVRTIAMSKNLRYIAFTTIDYAPYIYLIDTQMEQTVEIPLRIPLQSQYEEYVDLYFADVMTFNFRGDYLIFDGVSDLKTAGGETVLSWGLYSLRLSDFSCEMIMPAVPGEQFGDPIFAHTDDSLLLADLVVSDGRQAIGNIVSLDFSQGKIGLLMENTGVLAKPSFRGDDQHILFLSYDPNQQLDLLVEAELNPDRLSLKEGSLNLIIPSGNFTLQPSIPLGSPIGFREGEYESQEGRIAVSGPIHFGNVPVGEIAQSTISIVNQGNADLEVLSISIAAEHADWFTHQGLDGRLAPGAQYDFTVACRPMQEGAFTGELHIQSTD